jgi:phosphoglycolate phosphatase
MRRVAAVLFDLDGTLVDSAPDLAGTANDMLAQRGLPPLPYDMLRPHAGSGARGMLGTAFGLVPAQAGYEALRDEFHSRYEARMLQESQAFSAALVLLDALDRHGVPWGIVTNKALRFAQPMAQALGLLPRAGALVGGDSTPHTKPHPAPLLEAARRLQQPAQACVYVGDDLRDVHAGRAAGMATLAAAWGYIGVGAPVHAWGADAVLQQPADLLQWLDLP